MVNRFTTLGAAAIVCAAIIFGLSTGWGSHPARAQQEATPDQCQLNNDGGPPCTPTAPVIVRNATPTASATSPATDTPVPPTAAPTQAPTQVPATPTQPGGGVGAGVQAPNTGTGGAAGTGASPWLAGIAIALLVLGGASTAYGVHRRR